MSVLALFALSDIHSPAPRRSELGRCRSQSQGCRLLQQAESQRKMAKFTRLRWAVLAIIVAEVQAQRQCSPATLNDCRNEEDVITLSPLREIPLSALVKLPSGNCMKRTDAQHLQHARDPYTNLEFSESWISECLRRLDCPRGKYASLDRCFACPGGRTTPGVGALGQLSCSLGCGYGMAMVDQSIMACVDCRPGYFAKSRHEASCSQCPDGFIQKRPSSRTCEGCPAGSGTGSYPDHRNECLLCKPGKMSPDTASGCTLCRKGTYSDAHGSLTCAACPSGFSTRGATGGERCAACAAGKFSKYTGNSICEFCPESTYSVSTAATNCDECPGGKFTPSRGAKSLSSCRECGGGRYRVEGIGRRSCSLCSRGKYSSEVGAASGNVCKSCPPAAPYTTFAGSISPADCTSTNWNMMGNLVALAAFLLAVFFLNCKGQLFSD